VRIDDLALLPGEAAHPTLGIFTHDDRHPHVVPFIRGLVDEHHVNVSAVLLTTQRVIHHCAVVRCVVLQGAAELRGEGKAKATQSDFAQFMQELPQAVTTWPFLITCLSANTFLAIYANAWQTIAPSMFVAADYSESSANAFLLIVTVTSVIGGFASGPLLRLFGGRLKLLEWVAMAIAVVGLVLLTALMPSPWWAEPLFAREIEPGSGGSDASGSASAAGGSGVVANEIIVIVILCVLGFGQGVSWPPLFELAAGT